MAESKHRPKHKAKVKEKNIKKQKHREAMNDLKDKAANMPVSYTYHKDADHVKVPMRAWQMLNALSKELQPLAMLVSTFEQLGQDHINDGTLIPVFQADVEPEIKDNAPVIVNGQIQYKVKESFWATHPLFASDRPETSEPFSLIAPNGDKVTSESISKIEAVS